MTKPTPASIATATPTAPPPSVTPPGPTATIPSEPAPLAGRIAFPVDDGGGFYDVWVVELPQKDGAPLWQAGDDGAVRRMIHEANGQPGGVTVRGSGKGLATFWNKVVDVKGGAA